MISEAAHSHADNNAYYTRRAAEEAERAERAVTPAAKLAHTQLAAIFMSKAAESTSASREPLGQGPIENSPTAD